MTFDVREYRNQIEAALRHSGGTHTFDDVVQMLVEARAQAWVNGSSIAITEVVVFPRKRMLHCFLAGGKASEIIEMMPSAMQWGADNGCSEFTIAGRRGWQRVLSKYGWKPKMLVMGCAIPNHTRSCYSPHEIQEFAQ